MHSPHIFHPSTPQVQSNENPAEPPPPPPLPPPPPPMGTTLLDHGSIAIGAVPLKKIEKKPKSRDQLQKELSSLIDESDIIPINRPKAVENFMKMFPEKYNKILEQIISNYPFLIRKIPLKPKTIFEKYQLWESLLFKKLPDNQARSLREKKQFEIEKWGGQEAKEQIEWIWKTIESKKKEEEAQKKAKESQQVVGSMLSELKGVLKKDELKTQMIQAQKELEGMEEGEVLIVEEES
jgi:hypothetical protein